MERVQKTNGLTARDFMPDGLPAIQKSCFRFNGGKTVNPCIHPWFEFELHKAGDPILEQNI
jgi:hypothetical protein